MEIFLNKPVWSDDDWKIYFHNLDILRANHKLSKGQFNSKLDVTNEYRKDRSRPSPETISNICKIFNVTPEWLATSHTPDAEPDPGSLHISEKKTEYDPHGGWTPQTTDKDWGLMGMMHQILTSNTIYAQALGANVRAFHHAIIIENKLAEQGDKIKEQTDLIHKLEEKCDQLIHRIEDLEAKLSGEMELGSSV